MTSCLNCNSGLETTPKKRQKIFCNSSCRSNYWQRVDRLEKQGLSVDDVVKHMIKFTKKRTLPKNKGLDKIKYTPEILKKEVKTPISNDEMLSIQEQINKISAEKIPPERNTSMGKRVWANDQLKRIQELENRFKK